MKKRKEKKIQTFADRLCHRYEREKRVLACKREAGMSTTLIHNYLKDAMPGVDKLVKIAKALNVSFAWLGTGEGLMHKPDISSPDILSPENLKVMGADLLTVHDAVEHFEKTLRKQKKILTPKQMAQSIALLCMIAEENETLSDKDVIRVVKATGDD